MKKIKFFLYSIFLIFIIIFLLLYSLIRKVFKIKRIFNKVIFGTTPIISNKYWSKALKEIGIDSETLMDGYYSSINKKEDFDKYFYDLVPKFFGKRLFYPLFVWLYIINNCSIFVMSFDGVVFKRHLGKYFWKIEYLLFKLNDIKVIVFSYGSDGYMYSRILDKSLQSAALVNYPYQARIEKDIEERVFFWSKYADIVITGFMGCDGFPRWDVVIPNFIVIDTNEWKPKEIYSNNDGKNGVVKILHTPNHRGFKGTEFLIKAIEELKEEGLNVELVLLEKVQNDKVREIMKEVDILAEQFVTGYGLSAIEGMASGLPVLSNLDNPNYTEVYRRYSFLDECPIVSTRIEDIKENLRMLIINPKLREELGKLSRRYVEKYHSFTTFQYLFTNILKKLNGEDVDLINLFHPLKSEYVKYNYIKVPLNKNKLKM
jgi:glycosyltransferase involved in cell wall biosynthesis